MVLPFALIGNPLLQLIGNSDKNGIGQTLLFILGALSIYGLFYWSATQKRKKARAALIGGKVDGVFHDDSLDFSINGKTTSISYGAITKIGRDDRGLAIILGKHGTLWFPTTSFSSSSHRDAVFDRLGSVLKRKG